MFDLVLYEVDLEDKKHIDNLDCIPDKQAISLESSIEIACKVLEANKHRIQLGGCSLNTLRMFNHLYSVQNNSQYASCFIFSTGNDKLSDLYCCKLNEARIKQFPLVNEGKSNSFCIAKIDESKEKSFYRNNQTARMITLDHIKMVLQSEFYDTEEPKLFLLDSYLINNCFDSYIYVCEYLKSMSNIKLVYNIADIYFYSQNTEKINKIITEYADVLVCNEVELEVLMLKNLNDQVINPNSFLALAKFFSFPQYSEKFGRNKIFVSTRAEKPTWLALSQLKDIEIVTELVECEVVSLDNKKIIDFLGAGDSFTSGFMIGYLHLLKKQRTDLSDYQKCLRLGNQVASKTICIKGFNILDEDTPDFLKYIGELSIINN